MTAVSLYATIIHMLTHRRRDIMTKPTSQQLRTWINRQRTLGTPSPKYLAFLRKQYLVQCHAEVLVNNKQKEEAQ